MHGAITAKRGFRHRRGLLLAAALVVGAVAAEVLARIVATGSGRPWDPAAARAALFDFREVSPRPRFGPAAAELGPESPVLHPYVAWKRRAAIVADTAARGRASAESFRVGVIGGTAALEFVVREGSRLVERLAADPAIGGRPVRIVPLCERDHTAPQHAMAVEWAFALGMSLDAVVHVDGFEAAELGLANAQAGVWPLYPSFATYASLLAPRTRSQDSDRALAAWWLARTEAERRAARVLRSRILASAWLGPSAVRYVERAWRDCATAFEALEVALADARANDISLYGPTPPHDAASTSEWIATGWIESSASIAASCRKRGIRYLHVVDPVASSALPHDDASPWTGAGPLARARALLRAAAPSLVERGVAFVAPPLVADDDRDASHRLADSIANALLDTFQ